MITDDSSKDDFQAAAATLKDKGIQLISVGLNRARQDMLMRKLRDSGSSADIL